MTEFVQPADGISLIQCEPEQLAALEAEVLDASGRQRMVPAATYAKHEPGTCAAFCVKHGIYGLVTTELVEFIREHINHRRAIEIGSGDGVLAEALGIIGTDSYQQEQPEIRAHYEALRQPIVKYGPRVRCIDGEKALATYAPQVIVASWLTHKWKPEEPERGGNMYAPDELHLLANCETLIFVGNTSAHKGHRLLQQPNLHFAEPWLYSRALRGTNFVGIWKGGKA